MNKHTYKQNAIIFLFKIKNQLKIDSVKVAWHSRTVHTQKQTNDRVSHARFTF